MDTRKIIDYAQDGNAVGVRESLYASIWDRVHAAIEAKKQEIAQNLVAQESYEGPGDDEEDDWDEEDEQVKEAYHDDEEDADVRIADKELKKRGISLPKVKGVNPDKDMSKLAKRTPKEKEED
jgi:hypothetical protein